MRTLDAFLGGFAWWRHRRGGRWEWWEMMYPAPPRVWFRREWHDPWERPGLGERRILTEWRHP